MDIQNNKIMNEDKLHEIARDIMEKLNEKYNITNELSLDEYLDEFRGMLIEDEIEGRAEEIWNNEVKPKEDLMAKAIAECIQMDIDRGVEPNLD